MSLSTENSGDSNNTEQQSVNQLFDDKVNYQMAIPAQSQIVVQQNFKHRILLLEDSTFDSMPKHVHEMLLGNLLPMQRLSKADVLAAFVYIVALESGFVPSKLQNDALLNTTANTTITADHYHQQHHESITNNWCSSFNIRLLEEYTVQFPANIYWNDEISSYCIHFNLFHVPEQQCQLLARETGDSLCITFNCLTSVIGKSLYLPASRYVLKKNCIEQQSQNYQNLRELSYKLKNTLFWPIKCMVLERNRNYIVGLSGIPVEIIFWAIFKRLSAKDLQNIAQVSVDLRAKVFLFIEQAHRNIYESRRGRLII